MRPVARLAALVAMMLCQGGCYLSHERSDREVDVDGGRDTARCNAFGEPVEVASVGNVDIAIAAVDTGFTIAWMYRGGLVAKMYDVRGVASSERIEVRASGARVDTVALVAEGGGARAFWLNQDLELWTAVIDGSGAVSGLAALDTRASQRVPLYASREGDRATLILAGDDGPVALEVTTTGTVASRRALTSTSPPWTWAAATVGEETIVAWSDRPAMADDVLFFARNGGPPVELLRAPSALVSHFGRPVRIAHGAGWIAASLVDDSVLFRLAEGVERIPLGTMHPHRPVLVPTPDGALVIAAGGPRGAGSGPTTLALRRVDVAGRLAEPVPIAAVPTSCQIMWYDGASRPDADAVAWNDSCGGIELRTCVR